MFGGHVTFTVSKIFTAQTKFDIFRSSFTTQNFWTIYQEALVSLQCRNIFHNRHMNFISGMELEDKNMPMPFLPRFVKIF
jgi:hypothetical protein